MNAPIAFPMSRIACRLESQLSTEAAKPTNTVEFMPFDGAEKHSSAQRHSYTRVTDVVVHKAAGKKSCYRTRSRARQDNHVRGPVEQVSNSQSYIASHDAISTHLQTGADSSDDFSTNPGGAVLPLSLYWVYMQPAAAQYLDAFETDG